MPHQQLIHNILSDIRVELLDEFDNNFKRGGFFSRKWPAKQDRSPSFLTKTGKLRRSITAAIRGNTVLFTSSEPYSECTKEQETSMSTLWHELTHNRHKGSYDSGCPESTKYMELANEFVSRNTIDKFFNDLGGELKHTELMTNRENTAYNPWVVKYQNAIEENGIDKAKVVEYVQDYLFNKDYKTQDVGLIEALQKNSDGKLTYKEAEEIVINCLK